MDSKLINTYAYLREHYPELDILHGEPTSYINTLSGVESRKIIFVHKFVSIDIVLLIRSLINF